MNQVEHVRRALARTTVVLVGGDKRADHARRIKCAFDLRELIWIPTRDSDPSSRRFGPTLARCDASLVVGLNGLLRHQHIRDLRAICAEHRLLYLAYWRSPHPEGLAAAFLAHRAVRSDDRRSCLSRVFSTARPESVSLTATCQA